MNLGNLIEKAATSRFHRKLLSRGLNRMVPFNKPHRFSIEEISHRKIKVKLPYIKRNLNHIKGLHACAMATLAEVSSGFLLISNLNPKKYRLILQKLEMEYHYQGKTDGIAEFVISEEWWENILMKPINEEGLVLIPCKVEIKDLGDNLLATGIAHWQIKSWDQVKTR